MKNCGDNKVTLGYHRENEPNNILEITLNKSEYGKSLFNIVKASVGANQDVVTTYNGIEKFGDDVLNWARDNFQFKTNSNYSHLYCKFNRRVRRYKNIKKLR